MTMQTAMNLSVVALPYWALLVLEDHDSEAWESLTCSQKALLQDWSKSNQYIDILADDNARHATGFFCDKPDIGEAAYGCFRCIVRRRT